jgi:hypothetical protein
VIDFTDFFNDLVEVRPIIQNASSLDMLGLLQFFHADATYRMLLKSESKGPLPSGFAHPLLARFPPTPHPLSDLFRQDRSWNF